MPDRPAILFLYCFALFFADCTSPVRNTGGSSYSTRHFSLHYYEHEYTLAEIETIAGNKERLLDHVKQALAVPFDGTIDCYLFRTPPGHAWATYDGMIFEPRDYVFDDPGHEIVHVVAYATLGTTRNHFLAEGLAEALQLDYQHPAARYCKRCADDDTDSCRSILADFSDDAFDYSTCSYYRAGAFVDYCISVAGIDAVKELYRASGSLSGQALADTFTTIFSLSPDSMISAFYTRYIGEVTADYTFTARTVPP